MTVLDNKSTVNMQYPLDDVDPSQSVNNNINYMDKVTVTLHLDSLQAWKWGFWLLPWWVFGISF